MRGHTLLWHNQTPAWFFTDPKDASKPASKALLLQQLKSHVTTVVSHFKGQVYAWDVVNDVLSDGKGDAVYQLVKSLKGKGLPGDVVGLQGHVSLYGPSVEDFRTAIRRVASLSPVDT